MMYLNFKNIEVFYGGVRALKNVSINLSKEEIVTLLGSNGAGKTTVLRAITGLKKQTSGEIWFKGKRIDMLRPHERVSLGINMVPEERHIFPYMSVKDNLLIGAYLCRDNNKIRRKLERIFELFPRLQERSKQMGEKLSGGEQQMLAVARCLMADPELILMDEPSMGLAPKIVKDIEKIITIINKAEKVSIILVEQNSKMALNISDRAYIIELGKIALEDKPENLINNEKIKRLYLGG